MAFMGHFYSANNRREKRSAKKVLSVTGGIFCTALTALLLMMVAGGSGITQVPVKSGSELGLMDRYDMAIGNAVSDAVDGVLSIDKVYFLSDDAPAAPKPNPECQGETEDPAQMKGILEDARKRLNIEEDLIFSTDTQILPGTKIRYYLDDTIFSVTWKQPVGTCIYSFSEVKIAHPSQFRRFLSGNQYGSGVLYTASEMAESVNAVTASSADYYAYRKAGCMVYNGRVCRVEENTLDTCFIDDKGDLLFSKVRAPETASKKAVQDYVNKHNIRFSLAFGPVLIDEGEVTCPRRYGLGEIDECLSRAALCQQGPLHYVVVTANLENYYPTPPTIWEFSGNLAAMGIQKAYAMDGGQTATLIANNEIVNCISYGNERMISDIIYFATAIPEQK